jgi:hypothetical protein
MDVGYPANYCFSQAILSFFGDENLENFGNVYYSSANFD